MKLGLQIPIYTWEGGPPKMASKLGEIAKTAEDVGFDSVWVMDHFFQLPMIGAAEMDMLEAYTTLGYLAAQTKAFAGSGYRYRDLLVSIVSSPEYFRASAPAGLKPLSLPAKPKVVAMAAPGKSQGAAQ